MPGPQISSLEQAAVSIRNREMLPLLCVPKPLTAQGREEEAESTF